MVVAPSATLSIGFAVECVVACTSFPVERLGTFVLEAGDRDFLPAGTYHSARVIGEEPVMYLVGAK